MKTETAYVAYNLVRQLEALRVDSRQVRKHSELSDRADRELGMSVTYDHSRGIDDTESVELDYYETQQFFQFLDDIMRKREENVIFEIERLENNSNIIKLSYNQYMNAARPNAKVFEEVLQTDLLVLITQELLHQAEEVWLFHDTVEGNPGRRLK